MLIWGILVFTVQILTCLLILLQRRDPVSSIAWFFFVLLFPVFGVLMYFIFGYFPFERKQRRIRKYRGKRDLLRELTHHVSFKRAPYKHRDEELKALLQQEDLINTSHLLENLTGHRMTYRNNIQTLVDGNETYQVMEEHLLQAEKYILFQFFIFNADHAGERFREILIRKAREGVKVYFLYDHLANLFLPGKFLRPMVEAGIQVVSFSPVYSFARKFQFNFRNHRKIIIIDGYKAFTGGLNIGRDYLGENRKLKGWRDNHFFIEGPVAADMEKTFQEDWFFATNKQIALPSAGSAPLPGTDNNVLMQSVPSGPNDFVDVKHLTFTQLVETAQKSLWIQTPYFIPDISLIHAFQLASLRGLDVRIMVPKIAQYAPIHYASHSFFPELLETGVKIYRYLPSFLHTKTCIIDDSITLIGSTNIDNRSFRLSFELDLLVINKAFNRELKSLFHGDLARSEEVDIKKLRELKFPRLLLTNFCRLFAPVL